VTRARAFAVAVAAVLVAAVGLALALRDGDDDRQAVTVPTTAPAATEMSPPSQTTQETVPTETVGTTGTTTAQSELPYALGPTRTCLRAAGAAVSPVRSTDPRLRALGDLAQRTSLEVRLAGQTLGVAFGDARLLESLLIVPDDPYVLEVRRNALIMYRRDAQAEAAVLRGCLSG
jgi:hypothetical protein